MIRRRKNGARRFMILLFGSLAGATLALLFAPQSGEKTRQQVARYGKKIGNRAQDFVGEIASAMDDVLGDILEYSEGGLHKGKKLTDRARTEILDVLDAGKKFIEEERNKLDRILK